MKQHEDMKWLDRIDHIVYCTHDLEQSMDDFEVWTGVRPVIGGRHIHQGTKNALARIGERTYFEILAPDEDNTDVPPPRWMGIDLITAPKITRWAIQTSKINEDAKLLEDYNVSLSTIIEGQRKTTSGEWLKWSMTAPASTPEVEVMPFLLDWSASAYHPCERMEQLISIQRMAVYHPSADDFDHHFNQLHIGMATSSEHRRIRITLNTPKGVISID